MKCVYIIEWIGQQIFPKAINRTPATNLAVCNKMLDLFGDIPVAITIMEFLDATAST